MYELSNNSLLTKLHEEYRHGSTRHSEALPILRRAKQRGKNNKKTEKEKKVALKITVKICLLLKTHSSKVPGEREESNEALKKTEKERR